MLGVSCLSQVEYIKFRDLTLSYYLMTKSPGKLKNAQPTLQTLGFSVTHSPQRVEVAKWRNTGPALPGVVSLVV